MKKTFLLLLASILFFLVIALPMLQSAEQQNIGTIAYYFIVLAECSALLLLSLVCYQLYKPSTK